MTTQLASHAAAAPPDRPGHYPPTLPASWYTSDDIYALEQDRIFHRNWFLFARSDQFAAAGDHVVADVWGLSVLVVRNGNGALAGFFNVCRHRAGRLLTDGTGTCKPATALRCRYHGWKYNLDGTLQLAPGFSAGGDFDPAAHSLFPVRVETWNGLVFVTLSPETESLVAWLGDIVDIARDYPSTEKLDYAKTIEIEGNTNWKLYGENGVEGYHLAFVHTWLLQAVGPNAYDVDIHENGKFVGFPVEYQAWDLDRKFKGYWILKYPGLLVHFSELEFNCEQVIPAGVRRTRLRHMFWTPQNDPQLAEKIARDWKITMQEDMGICEEVQRNLDGGVYQNGRLSPARERGAIYFQSLVRNAIGNAAA
ncbi:MAG: aromatic ring-hydroxylating dioxygenase subunit alpha [Rhodospirillaceae bacterium]|nr:aromatic ring-hydroxylating dioxygenase subunit alpha [Rhodospirillaceae bacterium]